jgi:hypothetical protein
VPCARSRHDLHLVAHRDEDLGGRGGPRRVDVWRQIEGPRSEPSAQQA